MGNDDELFRFIHDMSKAEKRFFRLRNRANGGKEKNYLRLFDLILGMKRYDAQKLRHDFEREKLGKQYSWARNHLFDRLLESMRDFHLQYNVSLQIQQAMADAKLLWARGYEGKCEVLVRKAKRLAERYEKYALLLELYEFERIILMKSQVKGYPERIHAARLAKDAAMKKMKTRFSMLDAAQHMMIQARRAEFAWEGLDEGTALAHLESELPKGSGFEVRQIQLFGKAVHAQLSGKYAEAFGHYGEILQHFESHPDFLRIQQREYILMLNNYLNLAFAVGRYDQFAPTLPKLEEIKPQDLDEEAEIFQNSRFLRLLWYMNTAQYSACPAIIAEIEAGLERYGAKINPSRQLSFCLNIAFFGFVTGDNALAWKWNQRILNGAFAESRKDIQAFARVFVLILAFQQDDLVYLDSLLQAAYQRQLRGKAPYPFERITVRNLKLLTRAESREAREALISNWMSDLDSYNSENPKHRAFGISEIRLWLNSLLTGRPMAELLQ